MVAPAMSKEKKSPKKVSTLKVKPHDKDLVVRVANARNQSVEELFESKEVRTFWAHLLGDAAKATAKEAERLRADGQ